MAKNGTLAIVGLDARELEWVRMLIDLLRHPDPVVAELTSSALLYLEKFSSNEVCEPPEKSYEINKFDIERELRNRYFLCKPAQFPGNV